MLTTGSSRGLPPPTSGTVPPNISSLRETPLARVLVCSKLCLLRSLFPATGTIPSCLFLCSMPFRCRQRRLPSPMPPTLLLLNVYPPFIRCSPVHTHQRTSKQDGSLLAASAKIGHQLLPVHSSADLRRRIVPSTTHSTPSA